MNPAHRQLAHRVRFDWGPTGASAIAEGADVAVVVDVLSFTTTVCVGLERGITVLPYRWKDERAAAYAEKHAAALALDRRRGLSPTAMAVDVDAERIVVPSPNGSALAFGLADRSTTVVAACLRNRSAVARWLQLQGGTVAVVAAGERWPDGSLRPSAEDLWGAGAVLALLPEADLSPEARLAADTFRSVEPHVVNALHDCASGRELADAGFAEDVDVAAALDAIDAVPVLERGEFTPATRY